MRALHQEVSATVHIRSPYSDKEFHLDDKTMQTKLEETNHRNLRSKISEWLKLLLLQHNVMSGAIITITIHPVEKDEFENPER